MKTIRKTAESGMAIILALILLAIFMILAFAFTARAIAAGRSASHSAGELQAQASCDAALESCIRQMRTKFDNSAAASLPEGDAAWLSSVDFEKGSGTAFTLPSNTSLKSKIKVLGNNLASNDKMNTVANDNLGINFFNVGSFAPDSSGTSWSALATPSTSGEASRGNVLYTWYAIPLDSHLNPNQTFESRETPITRSIGNGSSVAAPSPVTPSTFTTTDTNFVVKTGFTWIDEVNFCPEMRAEVITPGYKANGQFWKSIQHFTDDAARNAPASVQDTAFLNFFPINKPLLPGKPIKFNVNSIVNNTPVDSIIDAIPYWNGMDKQGQTTTYSDYQRQLAANLKDYIDSDDLPSTDGTNYCGHEAVPKFNKVFIEMNNLSADDGTGTGTYDMKIHVKLSVDLVSYIPGAKAIPAGSLRIYAGVRMGGAKYFDTSGASTTDAANYDNYFAWGDKAAITDANPGSSIDTADGGAADTRPTPSYNTDKFVDLTCTSPALDFPAINPGDAAAYRTAVVEFDLVPGIKFKGGGQVILNTSNIMACVNDFVSPATYQEAIRLQQKVGGKWRTIGIMDHYDMHASSNFASDPLGASKNCYGKREYYDPRATRDFYLGNKHPGGASGDRPYKDTDLQAVAPYTSGCCNLYNYDYRYFDSEVTPDGASITDPTKHSTARIRNGPMRSLSEVGMLSNGYYHRTLNMIRYDRTLTAMPNINNGGYFNGNRKLLDDLWLGPGDPDCIAIPNATINPNGANSAILGALFENIIADAGMLSSTNKPIDGLRLSTLIGRFPHGKLTSTIMDAKYFSHKLRNPPEYGKFFMDNSNVLAEQLKMTDREREELVWSTKNYVDAESQYYMVVVSIASGYKLDNSGSKLSNSLVQGNSKMVAVVRRYWDSAAQRFNYATVSREYHLN